MHTHQVVHRDLKLGNLFLDANMTTLALLCGPALRLANGRRLSTLFSLAIHSKRRTSKRFISEFFDVFANPLQPNSLFFRRIRRRFALPNPNSRLWDVSLEAHEPVQQILTPNCPTLHSIVDHAFFTCGIIPGFIPVSARYAPPNFCHISPLVSQVNFARLRQTSRCHLVT
jgi:cell cycle serine/threonine-protein kinase CDC5/MSD2